jgi:hypothetical protein
MQIVNPTYSFVKFGSAPVVNNYCDGVQDFCIPVIEETDTYFQFKITSAVYAEIQALMSAPADDLQLVLLSGSGNTSASIAANTLRNWTVADGLTFERYRTGLYEVTFLWKRAFKDIKTLLACDGCFQLAIIKGAVTTGGGELSDEFSDEFSTDAGVTIYDLSAISNCFKRFCDDCYTSILEYYNDDDYADFGYCNIVSAVNRVRLPFYLSKPKPVEDKVIYRKSNGVIKQTKSLLTKEYQGETEHLPEWVHDNITVALAHDEVNVISESYTGGISKNSDYAIEWTDNICIAPATFKALASPYAIRNNNCQECAVIDICNPVVVPSFTLPDATQGVAYSHTETLTGDQPFALSSIVKPSWMTISIAANIFTFAGTPGSGDDGTGITVSFHVTNACGDVAVAKTIDVTAVACSPVGITGSPVLPDGQIGVVYTYSFAITGTAPFTLAGITKPSWMTIAVVGSNIQFTGTPTVEATGISVAFDIDNCDTDSVHFSDTIDITCVPVAIVGAPVLPDGTIDVPYSYSFAITGTAPFTLTGATKPSWMTITVVGNNIVFSGTPDATDTGLTVSFTIENCTTVNFTDTIDVNEQCEEYYNNTGLTLTNINYTSCSGSVHTHSSVLPGQSICVQPGSIYGGGSGYLILIGNC